MTDIAISTYVRDRAGNFVDLFSAEAAEAGADERGYLDGAIEIRLGGKTVLGQEFWDEVEFLWWGLVDLVAGFSERGSASVDFPDQPLRIRLARRERQWLRMTVETWAGEVLAAGSACDTELLAAVRSAGNRVLPRFMEINDQNYHTHRRALERLERAFTDSAP